MPFMCVIIEKTLNKIDGVEKATVNFALEKAVVEFDDTYLKLEALVKLIKGLGFGVIRENKNHGKIISFQ